MGRWLTPDAPADGYICRTLRIPNSEECLAIVNGALIDLGYPFAFETYGDLTPIETAELFAEMYRKYVESGGCLLGTIFAYVTSTAPEGSLPCDGSSHLKSDYPLLYDSLDSAYIIDTTHFRTPDLRGRGIIGVGSGAGLTARSINQSGGEEGHQLTVAELAAHTHNYLHTTYAVAGAPGTPAIVAVVETNISTSSAGSGSSHNNMQPWLALKYGIWAV